MRDYKVTFRIDVYFSGTIKAYAINQVPWLWFFWRKTHQTLLVEGTNMDEIRKHITEYVHRSRSSEIQYSVDLDDRGKEDLCYF